MVRAKRIRVYAKVWRLPSLRSGRRQTWADWLPGWQTASGSTNRDSSLLVMPPVSTNRDWSRFKIWPWTRGMTTWRSIWNACTSLISTGTCHSCGFRQLVTRVILCSTMVLGFRVNITRCIRYQKGSTRGSFIAPLGAGSTIHGALMTRDRSSNTGRQGGRVMVQAKRIRVLRQSITPPLAFTRTFQVIPEHSFHSKVIRNCHLTRRYLSWWIINENYQ